MGLTKEALNPNAAELFYNYFPGGLFEMVISVGDKELRCRTPFVFDAKSGTDVYIHIKPEDVFLIEMH